MWSNPSKAQKLMGERTHLEQNITLVREIESSLADYTDLVAMAEEEGDNDVLEEAEQAIENLQKQADQLRLETLLSGEADGNDAYLQVNAGAGGTEAQDWAEMILSLTLLTAVSNASDREGSILPARSSISFFVT